MPGFSRCHEVLHTASTPEVIDFSVTARKPWHEVKYLTAFKRVRHQLRKFYAPDIIILALLRLHAQQPGNIAALRQQPPWFLLLLIKWTILYGDFQRGRKPRLDDSALNQLINLMHRVDRSLRPPQKYKNPLMLLRGMAYQQFWHQHSPSRTGVSRQAILFRNLDPSHRFRTQFAEQTGIGIDEWIDLSFMLLAALLSESPHSVTAGYFDPVKSQYPADKVARFLKCVSRSPAELREYLRSLDEEKRCNSSEFRERSPLVRFPLIELDDGYYYYSIPTLMYSLENFIYDTLKGRDSQGFMDIFGPMFERYVERGITYLGVDFLAESTIIERSCSSKAVDFAILGEEANILIDAKGVEMTHGGMTSHRPEVVTGQAKSSVLKGIRQGIETARVLARYEPSKWSRERNFLLIVTFRDLYLGTGADFFSYVVQERVTSALGASASESIIPLEHMYFISVAEFDYLVEALRANSLKLDAVLREISIADQVPETKCLQISQHLLRRWGTLPAPSYIDSEFNAMFDRAARTLGVKGVRA